MGECAQFICRYYVILYKGFMYLQILVSEGFSGTDTQGYWKTTATFFKFFWMSHVHYQTESQFSFTLSSYSVYSEKLKHFITITTFTSLPTTPSKSEISFIWVNRDFLLIHLNAHFSTLGSIQPLYRYAFLSGSLSQECPFSFLQLVNSNSSFETQSKGLFFRTAIPHHPQQGLPCPPPACHSFLYMTLSLSIPMTCFLVCNPYWTVLHLYDHSAWQRAFHKVSIINVY